MRYWKMFVVLAILMLGTLLVFWQSALAKPPEKPGNPALQACLSELAAKEAEIATLQVDIATLQTEITRLNNLVNQLQSQALVPRTGQTTSYALGDDGELQNGLPWPVPRFTDNQNGTVTDNLTGLMWLKDANCMAGNYPDFDTDHVWGDGKVTWQHALDFVARINDGTYANCGAYYTDWLLPNIRELHSLVRLGSYNPALPDTAGTGQWTQGNPFLNVQPFYYWSSSSTKGELEPGYEKWFVLFLNGASHGYTPDFGAHVWPVRKGE